ncbi:MAG TPA: CBS domain-containing protein [Nitrososphaerales archaeon]|jgi:signal-transduction protein with cAMP-binding, CBS, and nucleotidyltransferase domain|nr:CBS domain-containing protein [Nitrososphaerales archaeon]
MALDLAAAKIARPIITIDENVSVVDASKKMAAENRGSIVVTRKGATVGILTERDVMRRVVAKSLSPRTTKVKDVMTSTPVTIEKTKPLREALDLMNRKGVRRMLLTERGKIVGIFTLRDVMKDARMCTYCGKEIRSILETDRPESYIECECGSRYHKRCSETVVNCVSCSKTLVTKVIYPEPSETFSG